MTVKALAALTAAQGFSIPWGALGKVESIHKTVTNIQCVAYARSFAGIITVQWTGVEFLAIHISAQNIVVYCHE
jgi:hypothetical protein